MPYLMELLKSHLSHTRSLQAQNTLLQLSNLTHSLAAFTNPLAGCSLNTYAEALRQESKLS